MRVRFGGKFYFAHVKFKMALHSEWLCAINFLRYDLGTGLPSLSELKEKLSQVHLKVPPWVEDSQPGYHSL